MGFSSLIYNQRERGNSLSKIAHDAPWLQVVSVGLLGLADRATRLGGSPLLSCKRDQIKMRDYMDRRLTDLSQTSYLPSPHLYLKRPLRS